MNSRLFTALLGLLTALPASAAINAAANRAALSATRTLDWSVMGTLGVNVGNSEAVNVSGFGTVDVSCATGVLAQVKESVAGANAGTTGHLAGNFTLNDPGCYTSGAPITLSFQGKLIRALGFQIQSGALGGFTARLRYYSGENGTGSLLQTHTVNGTSNELENGSAVFLGGISDNLSTDFKSVLIDLTAATSVPAQLVINNVSFRHFGPAAITAPSAVAQSATAATLTASINADGRPASIYVEYGPTAALGTTESTSPGVVLTNGVTVSSVRTGLAPQQTLYYRFIADNAAHTITHPIQTYTHLGPGSRDFSFTGNGGPGIQTTAVSPTQNSQSRAVAVQPDGKLLVAGFVYDGSANNCALVRYLASGALDSSFGTGGTVVMDLAGAGRDDFATDMEIQADGKIVIAGYAGNGANFDFLVARLLPSGALDTSFDGDGKAMTAFGSGNDVANAMQMQADGRIVIAGYTHNGATLDFALARYNPDGSLDTSFDSDGKLTSALGSGNDYADAVLIQPNGRIVAAGSSHNGSVLVSAVVRYTSAGALDTSFGSGGKAYGLAVGTGDSPVYGAALQPDGKIITAGAYANGPGNEEPLLWRFTASGVLDTTFAGDGGSGSGLTTANDEFRSVCVQPDGRIVAAGRSGNSASVFGDMAIVRFNPDGTRDASFDGDGIVTLAPGPQNERLFAVSLDASGNIVAAGLSDTAAGQAQFAVVRLIGGPNDLLVNGGFEANEALGGGFTGTFYAKGFGDWAGDPASTVTAENGITPYEGSRMMKYGATSLVDPNLVDSDVAQYVDLSAYAAQIAAGNFSVTFTGQVNRVAGNAGTDSQFGIYIVRRNGTPLSGSGVGTHETVFTSDSNPLTWEPVTLTIPIAPGTTHLLVDFFARENVSNTQNLTTEFDGHYLDGVTLTVAAPPEIQVEQPPGTVLNDGASTVDFGSTPLGTPAVRTFTVRNTGLQDLHLTALTLPAGFESVGPFTPATIPPAGTHTFDVRFLANTVNGLFTGTLSLANDDADEAPFDLTLHGRAVSGGPVSEQWATRYNGTSNHFDEARAIAVDAGGNVVVTGYSAGAGSSDDYYTAKYAAADGALVWEKRYNGPANSGDYATALAVDVGGNVVVTGYSSGTGSFADFYTAKYAAADGALIWEKRYNGPANQEDRAKAIALDAGGNVIVTGQSPGLGSSYDCYTVKYSAADGALVWEKRYNGPANSTDGAQALALDSGGNVVVTGYSHNGSSHDYYTAKYAAADGSLIWEKRYNGPANSDDFGTALAVDAGENIVVTGYSGAGSSHDYYTAKYAATDGALIWEKRYNGPSNSNDLAQALAVDAEGDVVVTGYSFDAVGAYDYYTAKYAAADGALIWEKRYNGPDNGYDYARAIALDGGGNVVVTGHSIGAGSLEDFYTAKYAAADGALVWEKRYNGPANGSDGALALAVDSVGSVVVTGNSLGTGSNYDYATVRYAAADTAPTSVTLAATSIITTTATLNGTVNPNGVITSVWFEYGLTIAYGGTTASQPLGYGTSALPVSESLTGLLPGTTYHYRMVGQNGETTAYGADMTFTTLGEPDIAIYLGPDDMGPEITDGQVAAVDFGSAAAGGGFSERLITVKNTGVVELAFYFPGPFSHFRVHAYGGEIYPPTGTPPIVFLEPGETVTLTLRFTPSTVQTYNEEMVITTTDPDEATFNFPVSGQGADGTGPTITALSLSSNNALPYWARAGDMVTISFTTNEPVQTPVVQIGQAGGITVTGGPTVWAATGTVGALGAHPPEGWLVFSIALTDLAGNAALFVDEEAGSQVLVDRTPPVVGPMTDLVVQESAPGAGAEVFYSATAADANTVASLTYSPASGSTFFAGETTVTATALDPAGNAGTRTFTVTVNTAPVAVADTVHGGPTVESLPIFVLANDTDAFGGTLTITSATNGTNGTVAVWNGGTEYVTYTPGPGYTGSDTFTYTISDGMGGTATGTVTLTNTAPVAYDNTQAIAEDSAQAIALTYADADLDLMTFALVSPPAHGTAVVAEGHYTYTPALNYNGPDSFTFQVTDDRGAVSNVATIALDVVAVNDAPTAQDLTFTVAEDALLTFDLAGADVDSPVLMYTIYNDTMTGTVTPVAGDTHTFQGVPDWNGDHVFTYTVSDGEHTSALATVTIHVTPANDAPVAFAQTVTTPEDTPLAFLINATDADGDALTVTLNMNYASAHLTLDGLNATFTSDDNTYGTFDYPYTVSDGQTTASATLTVIVTPVNDAPDTGFDVFSVNEDQTLTVTASKRVLKNDSDVENDAFTAVIAQTPSHAAAFTLNPNGTFTYTPRPDFHGLDGFTYRAVDSLGAQSEPETVLIAVWAMNDAPLAAPQSLSTLEDVPIPVRLRSADPDLLISFDPNAWLGIPPPNNGPAPHDADPVYTIVTAPQHGTLSGTAPQLIYTPDADYHGTDSFTFTADDGLAVSNEATVTITVTPDSDGDQLPDSWEMASFAALTYDGGDDPDGDGQDNTFELIAGHDPADANSCLCMEMASPSATGGVFRLNHVRPGVRYQLQSSMDLAAWDTLSSVTYEIDGPGALYDPRGETAGRQFYRVVVEAEPQVP